MLQPVLPFALTIDPVPLDDNKGIAIKRSGGMTKADYPGLGRFPNNEWWRVMKPTGRGNVARLRQLEGLQGLRHQATSRRCGCPA